jgi:hypothetical protein
MADQDIIDVDLASSNYKLSHFCIPSQWVERRPFWWLPEARGASAAQRTDPPRASFCC